MLHQKSNATCFNRYPEIFQFCQEYINGKTGLNVLSFGSSFGDEMQTFKEVYFKNDFIDGVDINPLCIEKCKERFGESSEIFSYDEFLNSSKKYDVIFAMSVLCKWEDTELINDCSDVYPFSAFDGVINQLNDKLNVGGILVVYNSNFRMSDSTCYDSFEAITNDKLESGFVHKFDKHNIKMTDLYNNVVFKKI